MKPVVVVLVLAGVALSACGGKSGATATQDARATTRPSSTTVAPVVAGYSDTCRKEANSWDAAATDAYTGFVLNQGDAQDATTLTQAESKMAVDCGKNSSLYGKVAQATLLIATLNTEGIAGNKIASSDLKRLNSLMKAARSLAE